MAIERVMKNRVSFVPEAQQNMPRTNFKGIPYRAIPSVSLVPCLMSAEFAEYMKKAPNYLHDEEWRKHVCFNFPYAEKDAKLKDFVYKYKTKDKSTLEWARQVGL